VNLQVLSYIYLHIERYEKDLFRVVAATTAPRMKFPLSLIAAGKTDAVEESYFGDVGYHQL
jgi:hypothetical protein